ncbi:hypothetical protein E2320_019090 [Naja naja]|nr:hypothetical protein E2320_019090 [Naja naja]
MKEAYQKTIENVLIVKSFSMSKLHQRMKIQLELMHMASGHEDQPECKQMQLDTKSVIKIISAMTLTKVNLLKLDIPSGNSEPSISASPENKWGT